MLQPVCKLLELWSADDWTWVTARRQRKKRKVLVGFARATGDGALTATIHDVVVLPELQGLGLGRKLLAKATTQVRYLMAWRHEAVVAAHWKLLVC